MNLLTILTNPDPRLRQKASAVAAEAIKEPEFQKTLDALVLTMRQRDGIGLAATQVGLGQRVIVVTQGQEANIYINPEITYRSFGQREAEEGCLSVPGVFGLVKRHKKIRLKALDRQGQTIKLEAKDLTAVIFQHEIDHLDGILFIDKATRLTTPQPM
jgi:peptide deformylase